MRNEEEIIAAHDRLAATLLGDVPCPYTDSSIAIVTAALDALCWVLRHDHNQTFQHNLDQLEQAHRAMGFELHKRSEQAVNKNAPNQ
jgi:hypothetical protein